MVDEAAGAERLIEAAAAARRQGRLSEERSLLDRALEAAPSDPRALNARGMAALAEKDLERARDLFAAAAHADPGAPALWMNLATAARGLQDDGGEREALEQALSLNQLNFVAKLRLAELHERRGEARDAAACWSAVVQMATGAADRPPLVADALARGQSFLQEFNRSLAQLVQDALGPKLSALGPDARRFETCLDHALHGRVIYRNECAGLYYPFLPADEYFDRRHFPWLAGLEARTEAIRAEAEQLFSANPSAIRPYVRQDAGTPQNKWSGLDNNLNWAACFLWEYGEPNEAVCDLCPETAAALAAIPQNRIPGKAPTAFFSILKAGAHIPPHTGVTNTRAIVHLPLIVPPGCSFRVGGETRDWREGEAFVFDDTIEHEAWNRSGQDRVVLIFDVWNPHLSRTEQELLASYFGLVEQPAFV